MLKLQNKQVFHSYGRRLSCSIDGKIMRVSLEKCLLCNQFPGLKKFESTCHKGEKNNFGFLTAASLPVYTVSLFCKTTRHGMGWKRSQIFYLRVPEVVYWHYRPWTTSDFCRQLLSRLDSLRASLIFFSTIQYNSPIHLFFAPQTVFTWHFDCPSGIQTKTNDYAKCQCCFKCESCACFSLKHCGLSHLVLHCTL